MKFSPVVSKEGKRFRQKLQVKHISSSLDHSVPFHYLANMVDSEGNTLEKKPKNLHLEVMHSLILLIKIPLSQMIHQKLYRYKPEILKINLNFN